MKDVKFEIVKLDVYNEVAKDASYTGAKMTDDENAYARIFTTDDDRLLLERYWNDACSTLTGALRPFIKLVSENTPSHCVELEKNYSVTLNVSSRFDDSLQGSIKSDMFSYFTNFIVSKWYMYTNKGETEAFASEAAAMLKSIKAKVYYKKRPEFTNV